MSRSFDNDILNLETNINENIFNNNLDNKKINDKQEDAQDLSEITKEYVLTEQQMLTDSSNVYLMVNFKTI